MAAGGLLFQSIYLQFPVFIIDGLQKAWYLLPMLGFGAVVYNFRNMRIAFFRKAERR